MKKSHFVIACLLAVTTAILVLNAKTANSAKPSSNSLAASPKPQAANTLTQTQGDPEIPVHIVYGVLFGELLAFQKEALAREANGKSSTHLRNYSQRRLGLDEPQAQTLQTIAEQYAQEVAPVDREARRIIGAVRARYPHGALPAGTTPPLPPDGLAPLEERRAALLLQARERVRVAFGDSTFQQFDDFVRQDIAQQMQTVTLAAPRR